MQGKLILLMSLFLPLTLSLVIFPTFAQDNNYAKTESVVNNLQGIKIIIPPSWNDQESTPDFTIIKSNSDYTKVSLVIESLKGNYSGPKEAAEKYKGENYGVPIQSKPVLLNGKSAYLMLYKFQDESGMQRATVTSLRDDINNRYVVFKFQAPESEYDNYISDVGKMINSVEFSQIDNNAANDYRQNMPTLEQRKEMLKELIDSIKD